MFLLWWVFALYGFTGGEEPMIAGLFALVVLSLIAGLLLRCSSSLDVLPYSLSWAFLMAIFDAIISVPVFGWGAFLDVRVWIGYAIVAIVPLAAPALHMHADTWGVPTGT